MRILAAAALLALYGTPVLATNTTKVNVGANLIDGSALASNINIEHKREHGPVQQEYEVEHVYQDVPRKLSRNDFYGFAKVNYALDQKNYLIGVARYEYNHYLRNQHIAVAGAGVGHKIIRTNSLKVSNEVSGGVMRTDLDTRPVVRNSLWVRYDDKKYSFTNKMMLEYTNFMYVRNQTELGYKVANKVTVGLRHVYTRNTQRVSNVTVLNLGLTL